LVQHPCTWLAHSCKIDNEQSQGLVVDVDNNNNSNNLRWQDVSKDNKEVGAADLSWVKREGEVKTSHFINAMRIYKS